MFAAECSFDQSRGGRIVSRERVKGRRRRGDKRHNEEVLQIERGKYKPKERKGIDREHSGEGEGEDVARRLDLFDLRNVGLLEIGVAANRLPTLSAPSTRPFDKGSVRLLKLGPSVLGRQEDELL